MLFLALPQRRFHPLLLGDIAQNARGVPTALEPDGGQRQGNIDLPAVFSEGLKFQRLSHGRPLSGAHEFRESGVVGFVIALRGDEVVQIPAERFSLGVAEDAFGGGRSKRICGLPDLSSGWRPGPRPRWRRAGIRFL